MTTHFTMTDTPWPLLIGGESVAAESGQTFEAMNPSTGAVLARFAEAGEADADRAVAAARKAFETTWGTLTPKARSRHLMRFADAIRARAEDFALAETMDVGRPISITSTEMEGLADSVEYYAGILLGLSGETLNVSDPTLADFTLREPIGICGLITPWNYPALLAVLKIAPALAAGNTAVLKPSEVTPLSSALLAECAREADLPPGTLNVIHGGAGPGMRLVTHPDVGKISFTGGTVTGRRIFQAAGHGMKRLTLELGGKSPFVVMEDADLDAAVEGVVDGIWFNQGQVCCAGSRILVAEAVAGRFETLMRARMDRLRVGAPLDKSTDLGAIVHPVQKDHILAICRAAVDAGAELVGGQPQDGCFIAPGYLRNIAPANPGMTEEIFGPIATLSTFRTADEAVELANNTRYGLAASVWSESATVATDLASRIRAGVVWINGANMFDAAAPFGGFRESGYGREGGSTGMLDYLAEPPVMTVPEAAPSAPVVVPDGTAPKGQGIDRTAKLYYGGAQKRPDGGAMYAVPGGLAPLGGRKDIRNAVEAASKAGKWAAMGGHARAQVLYYIAENLSARAAEFAARTSRVEVDTAIARAFHYAAWADKFDGATVQAKPGHLVSVIPEPFGVVGITCPNAQPLAGFMSLVMPAIAMGNAVVAIPAQDDPLAVADLYQVFDTSDLPGGVVNIVTGPSDELARHLADHDEVAAFWHAGAQAGLAAVDRSAVGNLKPVWAVPSRDWTGRDAQGEVFLRRATRTKTIWLPYGALPSGSGGAAY